MRSFVRKSVLALLTLIATATHGIVALAADAPSGGFERVGNIVGSEIAAGRIPGAVVEIGERGTVIYRRAFGYRELKPERVVMTSNTIFDLASLTKPVATAVAIMQLVEQEKISLDSPVARYWPGFGRNGKAQITVRELMTHSSGLRADLDLRNEWRGYATAMEMIEAENPVYAPGTHYLYSDINFEVLGELVRRVSGLPLDTYCAVHVFKPLRMSDTGFRPRGAKRNRIAPTEYVQGRLRRGEVHDPTAARMGGVAGHAGLFSTADDLAIFAQVLLDHGRARRTRILSPSSVDQMAVPESPPGVTRPRSLGWDLAAPLVSNRDHLLPVGSYGHTGFTGTMLWIDPLSDTFVIVLTNRTYPEGKGDARPLRNAILALVSERFGAVSQGRVIAEEPALAPYCKPAIARESETDSFKVATGADVLAADNYAELKGLRVGLITNQTGITGTGLRDTEAIAGSSELRLVALFSPEHGLYGDLAGSVGSGMEPALELPVYSLYGEVTRPTDAMLKDIDALVFDVQDVGVRFYTYVTTMAYAMEAAARKGIDFYVLDRPNPIGADVVQGPVLDRDLESFTGYFPMPVRYGMTLGELAQMFNAENRIGARLHVIRMRGYDRGDWYDATGLPWVDPSPNLHSLREATLYPGIAMVEGASVSVGRGTSNPFELIGAPWMESERLAAYLTCRRIRGVQFAPADFSPDADAFANRQCHGIRVTVVDRKVFNAPELGVEIASVLYRLYPAQFQLASTLGAIGSRETVAAIRRGDDPRLIARSWQPQDAAFLKVRSKYLLY